MPEIHEGNPAGDNGWRLASVWDGQQTTGDYTVGEEITAYYEAPGTPYTAELTFFVTARGELNGEWRELDPGDLDDAENMRFGVDERFEFYTDDPRWGNGPDEVSYEGGSYLDYELLESANAEARRMALNDAAWTFASPADLDKHRED